MDFSNFNLPNESHPDNEKSQKQILSIEQTPDVPCQENVRTGISAIDFIATPVEVATAVQASSESSSTSKMAKFLETLLLKKTSESNSGPSQPPIPPKPTVKVSSSMPTTSKAMLKLEEELAALQDKIDDGEFTPMNSGDFHHVL